MQTTLTPNEESVNRAFSKQSTDYDLHDRANPLLQVMRQQVYHHLEHFLRPGSQILELNAGTGIDAVYLVSKGHQVHAIDISEGMIEQIRKKQSQPGMSDKLTVEHLSYQRLDLLNGRKFNYVFSNFGGLNCVDDLSGVAVELTRLLEPGARVTLVIVPPVCPWEMITILKGNRHAFRRLRRGGVRAHLEGEHFDTYYHSLTKIRNALGTNFRLLKSQALALVTPPPHHGSFPDKHPAFYRILQRADATLRDVYPFNRWGDHVIVTFEFTPGSR